MTKLYCNLRLDIVHVIEGLMAVCDTGDNLTVLEPVQAYTTVMTRRFPKNC